MNTFHDNIKFYKGKSAFSFSEEEMDTFPNYNDYSMNDHMYRLKSNINSKSNYLLDGIAVLEYSAIYRNYITLAKWAKRRHLYDKIKYINPYVGEIKINYAHEFNIEYDRHALDFYENTLDMAELIHTSIGRGFVDFKEI